jgi:hypothetical protein
VEFTTQSGDKSLVMENQSSPVESLIDRVKSYVETRIDLLRLKAIDKSSSILSLVISLFVVILFGFLAFMLLNVGIALLLGDLLGKSYYGFFIVAAFYIITGLVIYKNHDRWIKTPIANTMIKKLMD